MEISLPDFHLRSSFGLVSEGHKQEEFINKILQNKNLGVSIKTLDFQ
jgi:hypothetical protein